MHMMIKRQERTENVIMEIESYLIVVLGPGSARPIQGSKLIEIESMIVCKQLRD